MMSGKDWTAFFHNIENKQDLCNLFANFNRKSYLRSISDVPVVISNNMETWFVTDQYVENLFESNHEEADTRLVLHALYKYTNAVIVSKDTNVLILLVYMYALKNITSKSVCNFQSMKSLVELNSLLSKFFCYITWLLYHLIRRDIGRLTNEAFTSNPIVSSKQ